MRPDRVHFLVSAALAIAGLVFLTEGLLTVLASDECGSRTSCSLPAPWWMNPFLYVGAAVLLVGMFGLLEASRSRPHPSR